MYLVNAIARLRQAIAPSNKMACAVCAWGRDTYSFSWLSKLLYSCDRNHLVVTMQRVWMLASEDMPGFVRKRKDTSKCIKEIDFFCSPSHKFQYVTEEAMYEYDESPLAESDFHSPPFEAITRMEMEEMSDNFSNCRIEDIMRWHPESIRDNISESRLGVRQVLYRYFINLRDDPDTARIVHLFEHQEFMRYWANASFRYNVLCISSDDVKVKDKFAHYSHEIHCVLFRSWLPLNLIRF